MGSDVMKQKIFIIGCGMDGSSTLTSEAERAIQQCDLLLGSQRLIEAYEIPRQSCLRNEEIMKAIHDSKEKIIGVLVSGDPGFFSAAKTLAGQLSEYEMSVVCGISSMSYFCSRLKISWDDAVFVSVHGRESANLEATVAMNKKTFILTGGDSSASAVCRKLADNGMGDLQITIGQNLSFETEKIIMGRADEFVGHEFDSLSVMLVENPSAATSPAQGIPDEDFVRYEIPMTKFEVRSVSVAKLRVLPTDIIFDIGAGTGSVSIELARHAYLGRVYALEQNEKAIELIKQNKDKFEAYNLTVINAKAPEGLEELPRPDKVFVGGSAGRMQDIIDAVIEKNADVKIVINAVTLETLNEAVSIMEQKGFCVDATQVSATQIQRRGDYHMMQAQNPVFVVYGGR